MVELIITEKPSSAQKIATALSDSKLKKENLNQVPYYRITHKSKEIIVACAVGHLYTVGEKEKSPWSKYPVFDVAWVPTSEADKSSDYSKKYLTVIKKLAKDADEFTIACDYDIEGEVIGLNIIRYGCKKKEASRMKFSTLTKPDLTYSYEHKSKTLDWGQAYAGETRHILDFYYGINLTRALTGAVNKATGGFKLLSSGRVQGPSLKIIVDREKEIQAFVAVPYWQIELNGKVKSAPIVAMHVEEKFWEKEKADLVMKRVSGVKVGKVANMDKKSFNQAPPFPFDLTSMQIEAHRCFSIKPKQTLEIAQKLYTEGLISYPRTSSQKLPEQLGLKGIVEQIKKQELYAELAKKVLKTSLKPNEGKKTDDAHPAIYPTGIEPEGIDEYEFKIYDLIVKRFFAVFGEAAIRETNSITIDVANESFLTKGTVTIHKGWHELYMPYVKLEEIEIPIVQIGDKIDIDKINMLSKETKPPNRYTHSSIIHALEKKGLGTKATRAQIVETLFTRGYVVGDNNIQATELGIRTEETLLKFCPEILDEELTRQFEEEMEKIRKKELTGEQVLEKAKKILTQIIDKFKKNDKEIGAALGDANQEAIKIATTVGKCLVCQKGELILRKGKYGRFIACNNYPECKTTFAIPQRGIIKPTDKSCATCNHPMISVKQPKSGPQDMCINPKCPTKQSTTDPNAEPDTQIPSFPEEGMMCPNCKTGKMMLRKSFYGMFLGCDGYPKCKTMMKIVDGKVDKTPIIPKPVQKKKKKKS